MTGWEPAFFTLCIMIPYVTLTSIIAVLLYKLEKYESDKSIDWTYQAIEDHGIDPSNIDKGFDIEQ